MIDEADNPSQHAIQVLLGLCVVVDGEGDSGDALRGITVGRKDGGRCEGLEPCPYCSRL